MEFVDERANIRSAIWAVMPSKNPQYNEVVEQLLNLKLSNDRYLFNGENLADLYDLHFLLQEEDGVVLTLKYLQETVIPIMNEMIDLDEPALFSTIIFESPLLAEAKEHEEITLALQDDRGVLSDTSTCGKCGSGQNYMRVAQTRSVDEGPTTIYTCPKCKNCWSQG